MFTPIPLSSIYSFLLRQPSAVLAQLKESYERVKKLDLLVVTKNHKMVRIKANLGKSGNSALYNPISEATKVASELFGLKDSLYVRCGISLNIINLSLSLLNRAPLS